MTGHFGAWRDSYLPVQLAKSRRILIYAFCIR